MAVATGYVGSAAITWAASTTATVTSQSIGTASWDRIVLVAVTVEETATIDSCTIGGVAANVAISVRNTTGTPDNACAFFWLPVASGTTANVAVTLSATSSQTGRISVWAVTGAHAALLDSNSAQGAGATQTLGGVTVPTHGAGFWVFNNATTGTAVAWTNATERDDTSVGNYRHSVADTTTAGTLTITADGATTNQILAGISFNERPPSGWDNLPQNEKAPVQPNSVSLAIAACAGVIMPIYPYVQEAVPDFAHAQTSSEYVFTRTLFYQANIAPVPQEPVFVAPTTMDWQQPLSMVPPRTTPRQSLAIYAFPPLPAPPAISSWQSPLSTVPPRTTPCQSQVIYAVPPPPAQYSLFDVTSTYLTVKVLHYQDRFEPVAVLAEDNNQTIDKWQQPLSKAAAAPQVRAALYTPFVPTEAPRVTADTWLPRWDAPSRNLLALASGQPFVSVEAPRVTPDQWMQPFTRAVSALRFNATQITYAAAPVVEVNTRTEWDWRLEWNLAAPARQPIHTQPVYGYPYEGVDNSRAEFDWSIQWQGPPRYWPLGKPFQPFVPREATRENTVPFGWPLAWNLAAPPRTPIHTQPVYGYPYEGVDNTRAEWDWAIQWKGPPRYAPASEPYSPFVPAEATRQNTVTPDKWLQAWRGPPRYTPIKVQTPPFVPRAAVLENTVTPDKWLTGFLRAVPTPPTIHTQPFFGYPYVAAVTAPTTTLEWLQAWQGPPSYQPVKTYYQPWVPQPPVEAEVEAYSVFDVQTSYLSRTSLHYQDTIYVPTAPVAGVTTQQFVVASLTVAFGQGLRYICKAQATDGFVEQLAEDCVPAFQGDAFQADAFQVCEVEVTWGDQDEAADAWDEQTQLPRSSCCNDED